MLPYSGVTYLVVLESEHDVDGLELALRGDVLDRGRNLAVLARRGRVSDEPGAVHQQDGLEALGRAVTDGPPVVTRTERPAAQRLVAEPLLAVLDLLDDLRALDEVVRLGEELLKRGREQTRGEVELNGAPRGLLAARDAVVELKKSLHREGRVPELGAVVALDLDAVLGDPEVVCDARLVETELERVLAVAVEAREHVDELGHGPDVDVVGLRVLGRDVVEDELERARPQEPLGEVILVQVHEAVGELEHQRLVRVAVRRRHVVARGAEVDGVVRLRVDLATDGLDQRVDGHGELDARDVGHGQIDHATVAPETAGVERKELRHEPHLGEDGIRAIPGHEVEHVEPELAPRRGALGAAVGDDPLPAADQRREVGRAAQQTQRDVVEHGAEHRRRGLDVEAVAAVGTLVREQVLDHLEAGLRWQVGARGVAREDRAGHQEHGAAVVAGDVSVLGLDMLEVLGALLAGLLDKTEELLARQRLHVDVLLAAVLGADRLDRRRVGLGGRRRAGAVELGRDGLLAVDVVARVGVGEHRGLARHFVDLRGSDLLLVVVDGVDFGAVKDAAGEHVGVDDALGHEGETVVAHASGRGGLLDDGLGHRRLVGAEVLPDLATGLRRETPHLFL